MAELAIDGQGDILSEHDAAVTNHDAQSLLPSVKNDQPSNVPSSRIRLPSLPGFRSDLLPSASTGSVPDSKLTKKARSRLQCSKCRQLHLSCRAEPGESCDFCIENGTRCSILNPRPFRCSICSRGYQTESFLKGHITKSHPQTRRHKISNSVNLDTTEAPPAISSSQSSTSQIPAISLQRIERPDTSAGYMPNLSQLDPTLPTERAGSKRRRSPDGIRSSPKSPTFEQQSPLRDPRFGISRINYPNLSNGEPQYEISYQGRDQDLATGETNIPDPYRELKFEIFDTYESRNLHPDYVQRTLDRIRDKIEQYGDFVRGKDMETSGEVREQLRFLDEVTPLNNLHEIEAESSEIFGLPGSRLVIALRSMFTVRENIRLEEKFEILGPDVRLLKLPPLLCGLLAFYLLQLFTEKDPIREAELEATELTHGLFQAANTIQHSRLMALQSHTFQARLENRAKKLAPSLFDLVRPLTHWQQDVPYNGSAEQHLDRLGRIIFDTLRLAAELEARKGTFSFFWPKSGEPFNTKMHLDETDDSTPERHGIKGPVRQKLISCTLMPGVQRMMDNEELLYSKATVIATQHNEQDSF